MIKACAFVITRPDHNKAWASSQTKNDDINIPFIRAIVRH